MDTSDLTRALDAVQRLHGALLKLQGAHPGSLRLGVSEAPQERRADVRELDAQQEAWHAEDLAARYPVGYFGPQHGLTIEQAWEANRRLSRANGRRPITGRWAQQRQARRIMGILSAVKGGRCDNGRWGRAMHGKRGGNVMRDHALSHLRAIAPLGAEAAQVAREKKQALEAWERTGEVMPLREQPQEPMLPPRPQARDEERRETLHQQLDAWQWQRAQSRSLLDW